MPTGLDGSLELGKHGRVMQGSKSVKRLEKAAMWMM